jgi:hypothetical protein
MTMTMTMTLADAAVDDEGVSSRAESSKRRVFTAEYKAQGAESVEDAYDA